MVVTLSRLRPAGWTCTAACFLLFMAGQLSAQEATPDMNALSHQLHQEAKSATSCEELNRVLTQLSALRERGPDPQVDKYLADLQAWVLHRRGEAYVKQAAEATGANQAAISARSWTAKPCRISMRPLNSIRNAGNRITTAASATPSMASSRKRSATSP